MNEVAVSEMSSKLLEVGVVPQGGGALDAYERDALNAHRRRDGFRLAHDVLRSALSSISPSLTNISPGIMTRPP